MASSRKDRTPIWDRRSSRRRDDYLTTCKEVIIADKFKLVFSKVTNYATDASIFEYHVCVIEARTGWYLGYYADSHKECLDCILDNGRVVTRALGLGTEDEFILDGDLIRGGSLWN